MIPPNELPSISGSLSKGLRRYFQADHLNVFIYESRQEMGAAAACAIAAEIRRAITQKGRAVGIFASAASQNEFLDALAISENIEWTRVIGFHQDEFLGVEEGSPQSHRRYLLDRLVMRVPMAEFHGIRGEAANPEAVCVNYAALLKSRLPDFAVLEIGEDGRLAMVDKQGTASAAVNIVELDAAFRRQQVNGGVFAKLEDVPHRAISLSLPTVMNCPSLFVLAAGAGKQKAVQEALGISTSCTASLLRSHPNSYLFLDREAAEAT